MHKTSPETMNPSTGIQIPPPLIINADDLGVNATINSAIASSFTNGYINSASIIVNMEGFEEALTLADKYDFRNKIGIHFNLTEGFPLTDLSGTGLTDDEGRFIRKSIHRSANFFSSRIRKKIKEEIQQQYNKAIEKGIKPTHINSHHHIHTLPWISGIFIEFAKKNDLRIRIAQTRKGKNFFKNAYRKWLNGQYKKNRIHFSDEFENAVFLLNYLQDIKDPNLVYEVMVHPVYQQQELVDNFSKRSLDELVKPIANFFRRNVQTTILAALPSAAFIWH